MKQEIKSQYIDTEFREALSREIEYANGFINSKIKESLINEGLTFNIEILNRLATKADAIRDIVSEYKNDYLSKISFLPVSEKERIDKNFQNTINKLLPINRELHALCEKHDLSLEALKDGSIVFNQAEIKAKIESVGVRTFTAEETEYLNMLLDAADKLKAIDEYEKENNFVTYGLINVVFIGDRIMATGLAIDVRNNVDIPTKFSQYKSFKKPTNNN